MQNLQVETNLYNDCTKHHLQFDCWWTNSSDYVLICIIFIIVNIPISFKFETLKLADVLPPCPIVTCQTGPIATCLDKSMRSVPVYLAIPEACLSILVYHPAAAPYLNQHSSCYIHQPKSNICCLIPNCRKDKPRPCLISSSLSVPPGWSWRICFQPCSYNRLHPVHVFT